MCSSLKSDRLDTKSYSPISTFTFYMGFYSIFCRFIGITFTRHFFNRDNGTVKHILSYLLNTKYELYNKQYSISIIDIECTAALITSLDLMYKISILLEAPTKFSQISKKYFLKATHRKVPCYHQNKPCTLCFSSILLKECHVPTPVFLY